MRIAILTNDDSQNPRGGAGRIVALQKQVLTELGHEVRVFCPTITRLDSTSLIGWFNHACDFFSRQELVKEISDWKPDILISHNLTGCGFGTPKKVGVRWIHVLHDVQLFEPNGRLKDARAFTVFQHLVSWMRQFAMGKADLIVSPTKWLLDEHIRRGFFVGIPSAVIPNPTVVTHHASRITHQPLRVLFIAARLSHDKGADLVMDLARQSDFEIHMIGSGSSKFENLKIRNSKFFYHGPQSSDQIQHWMQECDVLLVPSRIEENQPTVILEAAACTLLVLASAKGGIPETMNHHAMMLVSSDKVEDWIQALKKIQEPSVYLECLKVMESIADRHRFENYRENLQQLTKSQKTSRISQP